MTRTKSYERFNIRLHLRVVEEQETPFTEDELPSLPGMHVYDTTGEEITETRCPGLAKCGPVLAARKKAAR